MDETEWLASTDPAAMLRHLTRRRIGMDAGGAVVEVERTTPLVSARKLRLWACACCRACWPHLTDPCSRAAVEVAEKYADGLATYPELGLAVSDADACWREMDLRRSDQGLARRAALAASWVSPIDSPTGNSTDLVEAIRHVLQYTNPEPFKGDATRAALLRDIVGNPFAPVKLPPCAQCAGEKLVDVPDNYRVHHQADCPHCQGAGHAYATPTVLALAEAAYDCRAKCGRCEGKGAVTVDLRIKGGPELGPEKCYIVQPPDEVEMPCPDCHGSGASGWLDGDRLLVLADALEESGCQGVPFEAVYTEVVKKGNANAVMDRWRSAQALTEAVELEARSRPHPIVAHLRSPGPHARGCWAVDLILGRE